MIIKHDEARVFSVEWAEGVRETGVDRHGPEFIRHMEHIMGMAAALVQFGCIEGGFSRDRQGWIAIRERPAGQGWSLVVGQVEDGVLEPYSVASGLPTLEVARELMEAWPLLEKDTCWSIHEVDGDLPQTEE
jgi:hypothetical protein